MAVGIEHSYVFFQAVALLTECVDRNSINSNITAGSLSVALLTECVDRNKNSTSKLANRISRTPYGVRG